MFIGASESRLQVISGENISMRWQATAFGLIGALVAVATVARAQTQRRSPHETVEATVAGATISITYGRPYAHGRTIMGDLVPYGTIWRTGADEATTFETSSNLEIAGAIIPAGTYTLFTIPDPTDWTLIINTQTGQWGTVYSDGQDMARVPMTREEIAPVEQFTITIVTGATTGAVTDATAGATDVTGPAIVFEWETTRLTVPFVVK